MSSLLTHSVTSVTSDTLIKSGPGYLKQIVITNTTIAGAITIYDSTTESGTIIQQCTLSITNTPVIIPIDAKFNTGLFVGFDALLVGRVTVTWA